MIMYMYECIHTQYNPNYSPYGKFYFFSVLIEIYAIRIINTRFSIYIFENPNQCDKEKFLNQQVSNDFHLKILMLVLNKNYFMNLMLVRIINRI